MSIKTHRKIFLILTLFYLIFLAAITAMNRFGPDRFWFGALNLYLPQALWGTPAILLFFYSLKVARKWFWAPLLCMIWVSGPIMGLCWSPDPLPVPAGTLSLRVMTCNAKYGKHDISLLIDDIDLNRPDVVLLQDAGGSLDGPLGNYFRKWNVRFFGQYVIASRYPLGEVDVRWIPIPGERHSCLRCQLMMGNTKITLYNVHFKTPREGLNAFRTTRRKPWYLPQAIQQLENNVAARVLQAQSISNFLRQEQGPVIVAGDLNSPDPSRACATLRKAGLHDAFAEGGRGYGYSYGHLLLRHRLPWFRVSWMRIDHILLSESLRTIRCWTGTGKASDHRPVIADLILKQP